MRPTLKGVAIVSVSLALVAGIFLANQRSKNFGKLLGPLPSYHATTAMPVRAAPAVAWSGAAGGAAGPGAGNPVVKSAGVRAGLDDPAVREFTIRAISRDYGDYLRGLKIKSSSRDLLLQLLVEQNLSTNDQEAGEYDRIIAETLGTDEYSRFVDYREKMPVREMVEQAMAEVELSAAPGARSGVSNALSTISLKNPELRRVLAATTISDEDLAAVQGWYEREFDGKTEGLRRTLSEKDYAALRAWFLSHPAAEGMRIARTQREIRRTMPGH